MLLFFKQTRHLIKVSSDQNADDPKCLIIDDTQLDKTGKTIEFIGKYLTIVRTPTSWEARKKRLENQRTQSVIF